MRALIEFLRVAFISFEFVFLLFVSVTAWLKPEWCSFVGEALKKQEGVLPWLPAIPLALCGVAFQLAWNLTTPLESSSRELMDWSGYWRLKMRRNFSFFLSTATAGLAAAIWIFSSSLDAFWLGVTTVACLGIAVINAGCMFIAALTLREILEK
jgi:hypothetical protein